MAKKQFQAESKRLLDLMIHSIYTNKEIFLREIISNASDAIDKRYFKNMSEGGSGLSREDYAIHIIPDKETKTLTITDNGIGMTQEELEENLGIIANSGSLEFKSEHEAQEDIDIIGQFGVGFYSAFMVSKNIKVRTKADGSDVAYEWESEGAEGYTIEACDKDEIGTEIILTLMDDTDDEKYSQYLEEYRLRELIKRYSDYIRYPIKMEVEKSTLVETSEEEKAKEDYEPQYDTYLEEETLNSMVPLWKKNKSEVTDEDYNNFYKEKYYDYTDPAKVIATHVEGVCTYDALLFIPSNVPYNYFSKEFKKGLQLYSSGVLIMDKCEDLLPDYFGFVRGLVDSQDLSLNISREMLQQDRQVMAIAQRIEKKITSELMDMQKKDREKYDEFYKNFGLPLKFGMYENYGMNADKLKDLVMFYSSSEKKTVTFAEYVGRMKEDQKYIYYACGDSIEKIGKMPQIELLLDQGYEVLYCTDDVDEFALKSLMKYDDKEFRSASDDDLGIEQSEEAKKESEAKNEENKDLMTAIKDALDGKVNAVKLSTRLKSHPVCFSTEGISLEMEKVLNAQPMGGDVKADKVLEINGNHPVFDAMKKAYEDKNNDKLKKYANLLYDQAMLIEGMTIEDPVEFARSICELMV
ncbi:molecular chaperone HtpG [Eubacterium maltosivorans]|uniref:molecular chaperone HtpG n=1 Tax=Eubacterium maltosivorans TaxID=2041044 RepID=UPI000888D6B1|nr:molecular chaperone HtpG [Eubacterium maltosivorans]WPK82128.1 Chaperone protein HtpG [Eubacterium maltosivorans]SDP71623.1 molecular chaperone HtpG [Eubacterium maltosivorans]